MALNYSVRSFRAWLDETTSCILNSDRLICSVSTQVPAKMIKNTIQLSKVQGDVVIKMCYRPKANLANLLTFASQLT